MNNVLTYDDTFGARIVVRLTVTHKVQKRVSYFEAHMQEAQFGAAFVRLGADATRWNLNHRSTAHHITLLC